MRVRPNSRLALNLPIESVEFVKKAAGNEIGLTAICRDAEELDMLLNLNVEDEEIEIEDAADETKG